MVALFYHNSLSYMVLCLYSIGQIRAKYSMRFTYELLNLRSCIFLERKFFNKGLFLHSCHEDDFVVISHAIIDHQKGI